MTSIFQWGWSRLVILKPELFCMSVGLDAVPPGILPGSLNREKQEEFSRWQPPIKYFLYDFPRKIGASARPSACCEIKRS
jgi:hypothetical protein